ncbi:MAG: proton-conducting membrane transporter [Lachnospiraceae bacterium]|nr:proton-conducting membrane transporter [Lachnospiraceae bacterium]
MFLLLAVVFPLVAGITILVTYKKLDKKILNILFLSTLAVSAVFTLIALYGRAGSEDGLQIISGSRGIRLWSFTEKISMELSVDGVSKLFGTLMALMFTTVGFYTVSYMEHDDGRGRFFGFYLSVFGVLNGIYMSSNLVTMYLFYELMTLLSLPLVLHDLTKEAISAGLKYLFYSIAGAFLSLISIFMIYQYSSEVTFKGGGILDPYKLAGHETAMLIFAMMAIIGFGCKAGLFPLHDWLPTAHPVAPAPASAILSGVITKSGVVAIIRLVFFSIGADYLKGTTVQTIFLVLSLLTVFIGSMMAYMEKVMKKRFAYSTVSQVSYVLFGLATLNPIAILGALLHIIFHSVIKDDLFLVAGAIIHNTGITRVDELKGIGKRMPVTIGAFTLAALALVGIPPFSGFISKWFLCSGAIAADIGAFSYVGPAILLISALLTAGYLFPITIDGFFPGKDFSGTTEKCEAGPLMLVPIILLGALALFFGVFPGLLENGINTIIQEMGLLN